MNIMVVDDSLAMRLIVMKTLREAGFDGHDIIQAEDGAKALEAIREEEPDLVVVGTPRLPGEGGYSSRMKLEPLVRGLRARLLIVPREPS